MKKVISLLLCLTLLVNVCEVTQARGGRHGKDKIEYDPLATWGVPKFKESKSHKSFRERSHRIKTDNDIFFRNGKKSFEVELSGVTATLEGDKWKIVDENGNVTYKDTKKKPKCGPITYEEYLKQQEAAKNNTPRVEVCSITATLEGDKWKIVDENGNVTYRDAKVEPEGPKRPGLHFRRVTREGDAWRIVDQDGNVTYEPVENELLESEKQQATAKNNTPKQEEPQVQNSAPKYVYIPEGKYKNSPPGNREVGRKYRTKDKTGWNVYDEQGNRKFIPKVKRPISKEAEATSTPDEVITETLKKAALEREKLDIERDREKERTRAQAKEDLKRMHEDMELKARRVELERKEKEVSDKEKKLELKLNPQKRETRHDDDYEYVLECEYDPDSDRVKSESKWEKKDDGSSERTRKGTDGYVCIDRAYPKAKRPISKEAEKESSIPEPTTVEKPKPTALAIYYQQPENEKWHIWIPFYNRPDQEKSDAQIITEWIIAGLITVGVCFTIYWIWKNYDYIFSSIPPDLEGKIIDDVPLLGEGEKVIRIFNSITKVKICDLIVRAGESIGDVLQRFETDEPWEFQPLVLTVTNRMLLLCDALDYALRCTKAVNPGLEETDPDAFMVYAKSNLKGIIKEGWTVIV